VAQAVGIESVSGMQPGVLNFGRTELRRSARPLIWQPICRSQGEYYVCILSLAVMRSAGGVAISFFFELPKETNKS